MASSRSRSSSSSSSSNNNSSLVEANVGSPESAIPVLLVTANVGSVFEDPDRLLTTWIDAFVAKVAAARPAFIALHLQEVGGKTYEKSMEYVQDFIRLLCERPALERFTRIRVYLDEDYTSAEHFTALGNLYFADGGLADVRIWNFLTHEWEPVADKSIHTGNIEAVATKEKAKFPQHFFPECKWSRKGFLRTRWTLAGTVVDLVNIHLFHDASNLAACEEFPSVYCKSRRRALVHTMERFHTDGVNGVAPYFVFGDFNFRCDTAGVVQRLAVAGGGGGADGGGAGEPGDTVELSAHRLVNARNDCTKLQYRDASGANVLTIGKKEFVHSAHQTMFKEEWFRQFNREMEPLAEVLLEYPITFPPSYPYEEEPTLPQHYMLTRCPAWCDRVLMSSVARDLIVGAAAPDVAGDEYNVIGDAVCMGDHKPVYLNIRLAAQKGTIRCCACSDRPPTLPPPNSTQFLHDPDIQSQSHTPHNQHTYQTHASTIATNHAPPPPHLPCRCLYTSTTFCRILAECHRFNRRHSTKQAPVSAVVVAELRSAPASMAPTQQTAQPPPASSNTASIASTASNSPNTAQPTINVINADNEPICMCSLYASTDNVRQLPETLHAGTICAVCRNTIRLQAAEPRKMLVSQRLTLSRDIIVNRVDTHYLNLNGYADQLRQRQDPYTPESVESHSPMPADGGETDDARRGYDGVSEAEPEEDDDVDVEMVAPMVADGGGKMAALEASLVNEINRNTIAVAAAASSAVVVSTSADGVDLPGKKLSSPTPSRGVSPRALKSRLEDLQGGCAVDAGVDTDTSATTAAATAATAATPAMAASKQKSSSCCRYCRIQ